MAALRQREIVKVRVNPEDRDEHPAVEMTCDEFCADERKLRINVLYDTTRRPGDTPRAHEALLNGADGLDHPTLFSAVSSTLWIADGSPESSVASPPNAAG
jgi:hypothetical protein